MSKLHKKTRFIFFSGLFYALLITVTAIVFCFLDRSLFLYAAKELVFEASEIVSFSIIFSVFSEIFIRRFEN